MAFSDFRVSHVRPLSNAIIALWSLVVMPLVLPGQEPEKPSTTAASDKLDKPDKPDLPVYSVEELAQRVRPALVSISVAGREDRQVGLGTGFVISAEGLIATNLHVIGEGHRFTVELADGTHLETTAVYASESNLDLAILQVNPGGRSLTVLPLGDSAEVPQGAAVVAMGNPLGLKHSVVAGVISAKREIEGRPMLQLAMPIEPGNSGGPVLDMRGRVLGLVNMKSVVNENLGFAVEINSLKPLLEHPNSVPIDRWATIGGIDSKRWEALFGATWRQRAGRIQVSGAGRGFGGRSLCLYQTPAPEMPFELAVDVKLQDESGAAGLVFHADGGERHYGFYPSNGNLRLTCFRGPSVEQWQVLDERPAESYRPGEWNRLKVRVEAGKLTCYVNDELVVQLSDDTLREGRVGLAKFRHTEAEFRQFQVGRELSAEVRQSFDLTSLGEELDRLNDLSALPAERLKPLIDHRGAAVGSLRQRAKELEQQARQLQQLARDIHVAGIAQTLGTLVSDRDEGFDLLRASLLVAKLDDEDIDVDAYLQEVDRMAAEIDGMVRQAEVKPSRSSQEKADEQGEPSDGNKDADQAKSTSEEARLQAMNEYLFRQNGFHGARFEYYHRANSYMNRVIDDRAGLPITLSVLYMELGRRLGLTIEGVGLPTHFVVRFVPSQGDARLIDVFDQGQTLTVKEAEQLVMDNGAVEWRDEYLKAQTPRQVLRRMLNNLWGTAERARDFESMLRYSEAIVAVEPGSIEERLRRGFLRGETGRLAACFADLDWILERAPPGVDLDRVREIRDYFQHRRR